MINHGLIEKYRPDGYLKIKSVSSALSVLENENRRFYILVPKLDFQIKIEWKEFKLQRASKIVIILFCKSL